MNWNPFAQPTMNYGELVRLCSLCLASLTLRKTLLTVCMIACVLHIVPPLSIDISYMW